MDKNGCEDDDRTALIFLGTGCSGAVPDFRCLLQPSDPPCHVCSKSLSVLPHLNPNYRYVFPSFYINLSLDFLSYGD